VTLVVGVDGGGAKTHAVVADNRGDVLGAALGGPSNWEDVGLAAAGQELHDVVSRALLAAGVSARDIDGSVFGLAGVDWETDVQRLDPVVAALGLPGPRAIMNDAFLPLRAGTQWPWGVAVIAGTGSVAAGRSPAGQLFRTFGLGPMFGDEGSGSEVAEAAVRAVAEAHLGKGPATDLTEVLCRRTGRDSVPELLEFLSREFLDSPELPTVAVDVLRTADAGDAVARGIAARAGTALGEAAGLVARRLAMEELEFDLVLAGGLLRGRNRLVIDPLEAALKRTAQAATLVHLDAPEVVGAILMAMELATSQTYGGVRQRLSTGVSRAFRSLPDRIGPP
jgi:N-acetylglucosamine kinase-like BadF-type ATPase